MKSKPFILLSAFIIGVLGMQFLFGQGGSTATVITGGTTSVTPGTGATNLGKAEDAAHASGEVGVFSLAVRNDTNAVFTSEDGDYSPISVTKSGKIINMPYASMDSSSNYVATATSIAATTLAPANAANRYHMTAFQAVNSGASASILAITDGAGGTILGYTIVPAGGGSNIIYPTPIRGTVNTAMAVSNLTASTTIYYSGQGFFGP